MSRTELTGAKKAAVLLISLGAEDSAAVLKELGEHEIERITLEVFSTEQVTEPTRRAVIAECYQMAMASRYLQIGGYGYAEDMLGRALGGFKASEIMDRLASGLRPQQFDFLRDTDSFQLASSIQDEQPQAIALILAHIPPSRAAEVLTKLPPEVQTEVARRIAAMERTPPEVIENVEAVLRKRLSGTLAGDQRAAGGVGCLVKILTRADRATERAVLDYLDTQSPDLAEDVRSKMFVFENLVQLDDHSLQRLLRDVDGKDLATALRGASEQLREVIFRNLSSRAAEMLSEDIETGRPIRQQQIGEAQQRIVAVARRLDDAGEIVLTRGAENAFI